MNRFRLDLIDTYIYIYINSATINSSISPDYRSIRDRRYDWNNSQFKNSFLSLSFHMNMYEIPDGLIDILRVDFDKLIKTGVACQCYSMII